MHTFFDFEIVMDKVNYETYDTMEREEKETIEKTEKKVTASVWNPF